MVVDECAVINITHPIHPCGTLPILKRCNGRQRPQKDDLAFVKKASPSGPFVRILGGAEGRRSQSVNLIFFLFIFSFLDEFSFCL